MSKQLQIVQVATTKTLKQFICFPHELYRNDQHYVPLPNLLIKEMLNPSKNPFFDNGEVACFLAMDNDKIVGRIAAIYNEVHLEVYNDNTGFFGFFDCINDSDVAASLFSKAEEWLKRKGIRKILGPENLTTNDPTGILTNGFDDDPVFLMPYNFPYYENLLLLNGFKEAMTLASYKTTLKTLPAELYTKAEILEQRLRQDNITIRCLDQKKFNEEIKKLGGVYNKANEHNWGFMPLDERSFFHMAKELKQVVDRESVLLAEYKDQLIGFAVSVPDYNQVFKSMSNGKLFPFGWWKLLNGRKHISRIRIMIIGVLPQWRGMGIDWCFYSRIAQYGKQKRIENGEACYVMQSNLQMNRMMKALKAPVVKEYKLYSKNI
jgi:GNAT superfamily N-acetyltransferase